MQLLFTPSYQKGVIKELTTDILEADFDVTAGGQVEVIGWLYQYYNQEPKDVAFKKRKYSQADIPAVTQLFTPDWIVKYLVENSLGRYWINHLIAAGDQRTASEIADSFDWHFFMADAEQPESVQVKIAKCNVSLKDLDVTGIRFVDPASGSGHILVYAFDVFMQLYRSEGYTQRQAAKLILEKNLYGVDVDTRAFQLTYFSLMMKARQYDRHILNADQKINVIDVPQFDWSEDDIALLVQGTNVPDLKPQLLAIAKLFRDGNELGSLISLKDQQIDYASLGKLQVSETDHSQLNLSDVHRQTLLGQLDNAIHALTLLDGEYEIAVTNPPYMGSGKMPKSLSNFVKKDYSNSKADLFAVFMERLKNLTVSHGYYAMITQHQWMFLSSFEKLRALLKQETIVNLAHLGTRAFEEIGGEVVQSVAFVLRNQMLPDFEGRYERLVDFDSQQKKEAAYLKAVENPQISYVYRSNQANFGKMPGSPIAYWASSNLIHDFEVGKPLSEAAEPRVGLQTGNNDLFLRQWFEVNRAEIKFDAQDGISALKSGLKWFPYNKGGSYRKWYGNYDYVVNWARDGYDIKHFTDSRGKLRSRPQNTNYYFREAITWSAITSGQPSFRLQDGGLIFDHAAYNIFNYSLPLLAFLNSKIVSLVLPMLNPTINSGSAAINALPILDSTKEVDRIEKLVAQNISLCAADWNESESSWNFKFQTLLPNIAEHHRNWTVEAAYKTWEKEAADRFDQLKANEEELNRIFIDLYGLQDELSPEVEDADVSVRHADLERDIRSFLSYFIGVTFGRYSIDTPGLAFAGGDWDSSKYKTYQPNQDDVIVLTDDDYFGDSRDIINRLKEFLIATFGEDHLSENLSYIATQLNKKGETPEEQIRHYFIEDFFKKDHLSTYQKRPIYWELNSGKQGGFKALMYLHRYDENTMAMIRTSYLHPLQEAYSRKRESLQQMKNQEAGTREQSMLQRRLDKLDKQIAEVTKYDASLQHVANLHISLDLDDGVVANYPKAQAGEKLFTPLK
ncbi:BREX-1 system adenine-specific DNA-methyltransferase PglX [Lacticaseibacillus jixianensis]|uniref:BREX-1 system adenine-specific DNA-methyltransferase PglX n=1 Tax=Lacticaseibacillus jixianensis TaxID=2486012 RepID=UPI000F79E701